MIEDIRMGDVADFRNFMGAVIDRRAFTRLRGLPRGRAEGAGRRRSSRAAAPTTAWATSSSRRCSRSRIPATAPCARRSSARCSPRTSIRRRQWSETLELVDRTGPYALTGAVFARDRAALAEADRALRYAAGNYYINVCKRSRPVTVNGMPRSSSCSTTSLRFLCDR